jgi:hypothetical protein
MSEKRSYWYGLKMHGSEEYPLTINMTSN